MKDLTKKFLAVELVLVGTLLIVSLGIFLLGTQFNLLLSPRWTLPLLLVGRWVVWGVNQCGLRPELRPFVRRCSHYAAIVLIGAGLVTVVADSLRSRPMSAMALIAGTALCVVGGALIAWSNKEFGEARQVAQPPDGEASRAD